MTPTIIWEDASYFHELAALLEIDPTLIMAAYGGEPPSKLITVLYTPPSDDDDPPVWAAMVWRDDDDGTLRIDRREDIGRRFSSFLPSEPGSTE